MKLIGLKTIIVLIRYRLKEYGSRMSCGKVFDEMKFTPETFGDRFGNMLFVAAIV